MLFYEKARTCFGGVSFEVCSTHKQAYFMHFQLFLFRECFELILFGRLDRTYTKRLTSWIFRIIFVKLATVWMSRSPPEAAPLRLRLATLDAAPALCEGSPSCQSSDKRSSSLIFVRREVCVLTRRPCLGFCSFSRKGPNVVACLLRYSR